MCWVVKISFSVRVWHTSRVTSNNVEVGTSCHTSLGMPLNLLKITHIQYETVFLNLSAITIILHIYNCVFFICHIITEV